MLTFVKEAHCLLSSYNVFVTRFFLLLSLCFKAFCTSSEISALEFNLLCAVV